jgi:hypothetical protein
MWIRLSRLRQFATVAVATVPVATVAVAVVTVEITRVIAVTVREKPEEIAVLLAGDDNKNGRLTVEKTAIAITMSLTLTELALSGTQKPRVFHFKEQYVNLP